MSRTKTYQRKDVFEDGKTIVMPVDTDRRFFETICRQLSASDKTRRLRHLRRTERAITLNDLRLIGHRIGREVGIFYDRTITPGGRKTPICLYAGDKKSESVTTGASIKFPPGERKRFQIIAHYHPTKSADKAQLVRDIKCATDKVEVVINADGLVMYYNDDGYLNKSEGNKLLEALDNKELERYKLKPNVGIGPMTLFFTLDQMSTAIKYKPRSPACIFHFIRQAIPELSAR